MESKTLSWLDSSRTGRLVELTVDSFSLATNPSIGNPQLGHANAVELISFPHSGHLMSAISLFLFSARRKINQTKKVEPTHPALFQTWGLGLPI